MNNGVRFQKSFWILNNEDVGFGTSKSPAGYAKIEVKHGRGTVSISVQNLKDKKDAVNYNAYLLQCSKNSITHLNIGEIILDDNRGELRWSFDSNDVAKTKLSIDKFNVIAILAEQKNSKFNEIICPLVGYKDSKVEWREMLRDIIYLNKNRKSDNGQRDVNNNEVNQQRNNLINTDNYKITDANDKLADNYKITDSNDKLADNYKIKNTSDKLADNYEVNDKNVDDKINNNGGDRWGISNNTNAKSHNFSCQRYCERDCALKHTSNYTSFPKVVGCSIDKCPAFLESKSLFYIDQKNRNIKLLKEMFSKNFEEFDPFNVKRKDYTWWKVNNTFNLNYILYQYNRNFSEIFTHKIFMGYLKYKYVIVGIYTDVSTSKDYIVLGVPSTYQIDENPFSKMYRWVQLEGRGKSDFGAFGYWLIYVDASTGELLDVN